MLRPLAGILLFVLLLAAGGQFGTLSLSPAAERNEKQPFGIAARPPWTTSRVTGTPEPPPPYRTERVFPKLKFANPVLLAAAPGTDRLFVAEQKGKLFSFRPDPACEAPDLFLDLPREIKTIDPAGAIRGVGEVYGLAFHPDFAKNRYCYVCYVLDSKTAGEQLPEGSRVSRFRVTETDPPRCDPASETVLLSWLGGGHNGGCLAFGPDGYLYISTGDGSFPNPPDARLAGQDVSNLLSSILRIDVDHPAADRPYAIPADNPFVATPGARGEIWAYGFRNPWKITFDRGTGDLWAGDVGWELYEMIHRIQRGGNYGWSIMEGPQSVRPEGARGPTPLLPAAIALPHSQAASITGGYVYRGKRLPGLVGAYLFGDWETRRMWAARFEGATLASQQEIVDPAVRIVAFGEDLAGELYILDYDDGTLHQLSVNEAPPNGEAFPERLSETGLFSATAAQFPAAGVIEFSINAEQWSDEATAERWIALPGTTSVIEHTQPASVPGSMFGRLLEFPPDAVLVKTLSLAAEPGHPTVRRKIETQLLHFNGRVWRGYSYAWNEAQTDALLVAAEGADRTFTVTDPNAAGGQRQQTWNYPGRAACARCHNPWAQHTLAFNLPQLNKEHVYGAVHEHQLRALEHVGVLKGAKVAAASAGIAAPKPRPALANPRDPAADLDRRARAYLQVNCAHCHQMGAGGTADIELRFDVAIEKTKALGVRPMQGTFSIPDARILAAGDPYRSILFYRMAKLGRGRMPHLGSQMLDRDGLQLIHDWIRQLPIRTDEVAAIDRLRVLGEPAAPGKQAAEHVQERAAAIAQLLGTTSSALLLARTLDARGLPEMVRDEVLAAALAHPEMQVRDLFEPFVPEEKRPKRLGSVIRPAEILALDGDPSRGKELFFQGAGVQCKNCHQIGGQGRAVGPDLSQIGKQANRGQLLESILEPSKLIDPKFVTYLAETKAGRVQTGLLVEKSAAQVVLKDAQGQELRISTEDLEQFVPQRQSLMPELLLRDMTAAQVADLLAYLQSLK